MRTKVQTIFEDFAPLVPDEWRAYLVGGTARDHLLGLPVNDIDIEVFGPSMQELIDFARVVDPGAGLFGESFGVIKLEFKGIDLDLSIPRKERKTGEGHTDFEIEAWPDATIRQAAARRNLTINAVYIDIQDRNVIDTFDGQRDIFGGVLRAPTERYAEDPLRVLISMQMAGRFVLRPPENSPIIQMSREMLDEFDALSKDRIWHEWYKWAAKSREPSLGLEFLFDVGWDVAFPFLGSFKTTEQGETHHPEGNLYNHTLQAVDMAARNSRVDRAVIVMATFLHDIGKVVADINHQVIGEGMAEEFLDHIGSPIWFKERVLPLVRCHMRHAFIKPDDVSPRVVNRLAKDLHPATIEEWAIVVHSDLSGRKPHAGGLSQSAQEILWLSRNMDLSQGKPQEILMGRHLIELGWEPGPSFGAVLEEAYQEQLNDIFRDLDGALEWLGAHYEAQPKL